MFLFATPKPFLHADGVNQNLAIQSWDGWVTPKDILLLGADFGVEELAKKKGYRWSGEIEYSKLGTPRVDSIFKAGWTIGKSLGHRVFLYTNSDIIFEARVKQAIEILSRSFEEFLGVGRRTNIPNFAISDAQWCKGLSFTKEVNELGFVDRNTAIDYFIHTREVFGPMPSFYLGRGSWDNWLVWACLSRNVPVIDISEYVSAIHLDHDYGINNTRFSDVWSGQENKDNRELCDSVDFSQAHIGSATFKLTPLGEIQPRSRNSQRIETERYGFFEEKLVWLKRIIEFCEERELWDFHAMYRRKLISISPNIHEIAHILSCEKDIVVLGSGTRAKEVKALLSFLGVYTKGYMNITEGYASIDALTDQRDFESITEDTFIIIANSHIDESINLVNRISRTRSFKRAVRYLIS